MSMGMVNKDTAATIPAAGNTGDKVGNLAALHTTVKSDIVAAVNEVKDEQANKADMDIVADAFSAAETYAEGDYCTYEGGLYKFKASHSGSWNAADVDQIQIAGELSELKNTLIGVDRKIDDITEYPYAPSITIEDAVPANLAECTVKIEPVQDLHGYDHPWAGGAGKNKLPMTVANLKANNPAWTWNGNTATYNGATFTIVTDADNNVIGLKVSVSAPSSAVNIRLTRTGNLGFGGMTFSGSIANNIKLGIYDESLPESSSSYDDITVPTNYTNYRMLLQIQAGVTFSDTMVYPMVRASGDATFAPYTNICPISGHTEASVEVTDGDETTKTYTIALGSTIYGGTVDFDSGVMTVTHGIRVFDGDEYWQAGASVGTNYRMAYNMDDVVLTGQVNAISNELVYINDYGLDSTHFYIYNGKLYAFLPASDDAEFKAWLAASPLQVCYVLATPTTIQLTPQQIQLLKGNNTITASTGDISVTVNGVSGAIGQVQEQANATDAALAELAADIADQLPTAPTTDGAYVLTVTVADGTPTYSWESAS